ncbi:MAG: hypothetical protein HYT82_01750 [Candidatus Harrisonbacteria bacterium]|nr:hypothetical protein [Candidatus Harrisonbacteria bacterium]
MKEDFSELVEYLDKKFGEVATKADVDRRFDAVDKQFADVDRRFDVVVREVVNLRTETEHNFADLKSDFRELQSAVSVYASKADTYFQEMVLLNNRVHRLERWMEELAAKVGMKLKS